MRIAMASPGGDSADLPVTQFLPYGRRDTYCREHGQRAQAMSDVKNQTRYSGVDRRAPRAEPGAVAPRDLYKTGGRHGAITNTLYNWHSYKNWAEKIRGSWDEKK